MVVVVAVGMSEIRYKFMLSAEPGLEWYGLYFIIPKS